MRQVAGLAGLALSLLLVGSIQGCRSKQEQKTQEKGKRVTAEQVGSQARKALEVAKAYTLQEKEEYQRKLELKLDEYDRKIQELKAKAATAKNKAKVRIEKKIKKLDKKATQARQKLNELKVTGEEAWGVLKAKLDIMVEKLDRLVGKKPAPAPAAEE